MPHGRQCYRYMWQNHEEVETDYKCKYNHRFEVSIPAITCSREAITVTNSWYANGPPIALLNWALGWTSHQKSWWQCTNCTEKGRDNREGHKFLIRWCPGGWVGCSSGRGKMLPWKTWINS